MIFPGKIYIVGYGNVGYHLHQAFHKLKLEIGGIVTRADLEYNAATNANSLSVNPEDIVFLCVPDSVLETQAFWQHFSTLLGTWVHCSGAVSIESIKAENRAVFYPFQTFTKNSAVKWENIPILIETNNETMGNRLTHLAKSMAAAPKFVSSEQRLKLHLAAVFVNNFTNANCIAAADILDNDQDLLALLVPLLKETARKFENLNPISNQTGPAWRNDQGTISKHKKILEKFSDLQLIYNQINTFILKQKNKDST